MWTDVQDSLFLTVSQIRQHMLRTIRYSLTLETMSKFAHLPRAATGPIECPYEVR